MAPETILVRVDMGLGGIWKVGFPTRTVIDIQAGSKPLIGLIEIQTFDGDGVPVIYRSDDWTVELNANEKLRTEVVAKHGRGNRPIACRIVGLDGAILFERDLTMEERGSPLPATQPWIVGIGSDRMDLGQGTMKSTRGALPEYSTVQLVRADQLPVYSACYGGIDLMFVSSRNEELNQSIQADQTLAISDWIAQGGRCVLTLGEHAESWLKNTNFAALIPGEFLEIASDCDPSTLESYLGSQSQLSGLKCCLFRLNVGTIDLDFRRNRTKFPLIARWAFGAGKMSFLGTELDGPELLAWESRTALLKNLLNEQWEKKDSGTEKRVYLGYDDVSGQLNSTLDNFPLLTLGNLAWITILAGLFCLVIGPIDFFVVSRGWKKPGATWITLVLCSLGSCMLIVGFARRWKPEMPSLNCLELIEIDYQTQTLRGRAFAHCYGGHRGLFDFAVSRRPQGLNAGRENAAGNVQLDWFGQPGKGLGGFDSTVATDRGMPIYKISILEPLKSSDSPNVDSSAKKSSETAFGISGVGIPEAGTKSMCASWQESISLAKETNSLSTVSGSIDLLEGSLENPLDVDLLDALLIYRGRAYTLDTRIKVGQRISFSAATVPKDITRRLQRRQNVGGEERSTPWNPADASQLDRLMELISFHKSAGGSKYTGLYNRYLSELDCSDVIRLDRAILICEFKDPMLTWSMRRDASPIPTADGQRKTFLRLIIPVSTIKTAPPASGAINPANGQST